MFPICRGLILLVGAASLSAQQVPVYLASVIAGQGGPASAAAAGGGLGVGGLTLDTAGNLYISDASSMVYKLTPQGVATAIAGGGKNVPFLGDNGPATSATLVAPSGLAVDSGGNLYISDTLDSRIRKVSASGTITTIAGGSLIGALGDGGPAMSAVLSTPTGMAIDSAGNLYFADSGHNRVRKIATDGTISTVAGNGSASTTAPTGDGGPATSAVVQTPTGVALDSAGSLFIAGGGTVRKVGPDGIITTVAGNGRCGSVTGDGGLATLAQLTCSKSASVAVDGLGTVYVSDGFLIRAITVDNKIITVAGKIPTTSGTLPPVTPNTPALNVVILPGAVAVGKDGSLYTGSGVSVVRFAPTPNFLSPAPGVVTASQASAYTGRDGLTIAALGGWVEIYGNYLASNSRSWAGGDFSGSSAPTMLDGTSVTIGGQPAYVAYISPGQVNVQVPTGIGTGQQPLVVTTAHGSSTVFAISISAELPGILAPPSFYLGNTQFGVAILPDGSYALPVNAIPGVPSRPAQAGDTLVFYGIGFGPTTANVAAGQITPSTSNTLTQKLTVTIVTGATQMTVLYAGLAPGFVGLYQFNVMVPRLPAAGTQPVTFDIGAAGASRVYISTK